MAKANSTLLPDPVAARRGLLLGALASLAIPKVAPAAPASVERVKAAASGIFGREFQTIADAAMVSRKFETSRRREVLSFTHHREVAALPSQEADALTTALAELHGGGNWTATIDHANGFVLILPPATGTHNECPS